MKYKNVLGQRFGRLVAIEHVGTVNRRAQWKCRCDCGLTLIVEGRLLYQGITRSCGCYRRERAAAIHLAKVPKLDRDTDRPEYSVWRGVLSRCYKKSDRQYCNYGGRGIEVCERWRTSFRDFLADVGERPSRKHSIDRIDNDGNYEPSNVRWSTAKEQLRNTRVNHVLSHEGIAAPIAFWAEKTGIHKNVILDRVTRGWTTAKALTTPVRPLRRRHTASTLDTRTNSGL